MITNRAAKAGLIVGMFAQTFAAWPATTPPSEPKPTVTLTTQDGCTYALDPKSAPGGSLRAVVATPDSLGSLMVNKPREITLAKYSPVPETNRQDQDKAATELATQLAGMILEPAMINSEEGLIHVQDLLSTYLGKLPDGILPQINQILEADLGALNDPKKEPEYRVNTNNALRELTRVLTDYRTGMDNVNKGANLLDRIGAATHLENFFGSAANHLREKFQSVKSAIDKNDINLQDSLAHMRMRHEQMQGARLELRMLQRYLELTRLIAEKLQETVDQYKQDNTAAMSAEQQELFDKNVVKPLAMRVQMIGREQASVITAYHQFRLLMDQNLDLIVVIANIRETARLEATVFGAGKIIATELDQTRAMAAAVMTSLDEMRKQTIEQIRRQGVQIRELPLTLIKSTQEIADTIDVLLNELTVAQDGNKVTIDALNRSNAALKAKLERAAQTTQAVDMIHLSDDVNNVEGRRSLTALNATASVALAPKP